MFLHRLLLVLSPCLVPIALLLKVVRLYNSQDIKVELPSRDRAWGTEVVLHNTRLVVLFRSLMFTGLISFSIIDQSVPDFRS